MASPRQHDGSRAGSGSSEDDGGYDSHNLRKPHDRYTPDQIQRLEGFYKECAYPNEKERQLLGIELGLEPRQIKFWFQNKRTQSKAQNDRADNNNLRNENDRIRRENIAMEETLRKITCGSCDPCGKVSVIGEDRRQMCVELQKQNNELKHEIDRLSSIVARYIGRPLSKPTCNIPETGTSSLANASLAFESDSLTGNSSPGNFVSADQMTPHPLLKGLFVNVMIEIAASAMDEMIKALRLGQPLLIKSPTEGQTNVNRRIESSQYCGVVAMDPRLLLGLYLDSDKRVELFPTLFSNTKTIYVVRAGLSENSNGSLQLVHEQMHVLTPLMQQRKFYLLRCCQQIETGTWVIVDVSYKCFRGVSHVSPTWCSKQPSGCMIEEMPNGLSRVTCVERVEVDNSVPVHPLYDDLLKSTWAFGAKRWITVLQRTCERYSFLKEAGRIDDEMTLGRSYMIMLANKMIKSYCSVFSLFEPSGFHHSSDLTNSWIQIAFRANTCPDQPVGVVLQAACSFWVPASHDRVTSYLINHLRRSEWDVLCNGRQVYELMKIRTGYQSSNGISILQPRYSSDDVMIFQESMVDQMGSLIVFSPVDGSSILELAHGIGPSSIPILPSGFAITSDGCERDAASTSTSVPRPTGSIITAAFQFLASASLSLDDMSPNLVSEVHDFVGHTVCVIKAVFE